MTNNDNVYEEEYFLQILEITPKDLARFKEGFPNLEYEVNKYTNNENFIVSIKLLDSQVDVSLIEFIKNLFLPKEKYGLYISLISDFSSGKVYIPNYILDVHNKLQGNITFSYTVLDQFK